MEDLAQKAMLLDMYGGLLTPKQKDVLDLYYNHDLSLSEIAENHSISRQGVYDLIKRGEQTLINADENMGMLKRWTAIMNEIKAIVSDMKAIIDKLDSAETSSVTMGRIGDEIAVIRERLLSILNTYLGG